MIDIMKLLHAMMSDNLAIISVQGIPTVGKLFRGFRKAKTSDRPQLHINPTLKCLIKVHLRSVL